MKLLLDENLPLRLIKDLADLFPGSTHVHECGLGSADDSAIWEYAKTNGFTIVSKDSDFEVRSILFGAPPRIIWLRAGNCTSEEAEKLLRTAFPAIRQFLEKSEETCLILGHRTGEM